jgi:hypothetical protein
MILYKYFNDQAHKKLWLEGHGKIYFSPIELYSNIKCTNRRDELENSTIFHGKQKIQINGKSLLAENVKIKDDIVGNYISCFSMNISENLKLKFGNHILKFDADDFLEFLYNNIFNDLSFKYDKVEYVDQLTQTPSSPFRKLKAYEEEQEFRILMKIPNKLTIENLSLNNSKHIPLEIDGLKKYFSNL